MYLLKIFIGVVPLLTSNLISIHRDLFEALEALWERVIKWPDDGWSVNNDRLEWPDVSGRHDHIALHSPVLNCKW